MQLSSPASQTSPSEMGRPRPSKLPEHSDSGGETAVDIYRCNLVVVGAYFLLFQKNWFPSPPFWVQTPPKRLFSPNDADPPKRELLAWRRCRNPTSWSRDVNFWFQIPQFLVPEPPSRGGGAAQKIDREKSCGSPKSQPLGAYRCRNMAIFVSESKNIFNHMLGLAFGLPVSAGPRPARSLLRTACGGPRVGGFTPACD